MLKYRVIIDFIGVLMCYLVSLRYYQWLSKNKVKILSINTILPITIITVLGHFNNEYNYNITRLLIHILLFFILFLSVFREGIKVSFLKTIIVYLTICFSEIILSFPITFTKATAFEFSSNPLLKIMFSTMTMLFVLLLFEINKIRIVLIKISDYLILKGEVLLKIIISIFFTAILILAFKASFKLTLNVYTTNLITFIFLVLLVIFFLVEYFKAKKAEEKQIILLDCMSHYEKLIDQDRINKHEILNNLILLKSIKDSKKFDETINSIINEYEVKNKRIFSNLYNLPSGLKGIVYYKINEIKDTNINLNLNIPSKACKLLEKLETKDFTKLSKIFTILLDNAKEACEIAKLKAMVIDIYQENKDIIIYIENTIKGSIDIKKIYDKNYTTKNKRRGLGLYIVKNIIDSSSIFYLEQFINDGKFVSILKIKIKTK